MRLYINVWSLVVTPIFIFMVHYFVNIQLGKYLERLYYMRRLSLPYKSIKLALAKRDAEAVKNKVNILTGITFVWYFFRGFGEELMYVLPFMYAYNYHLENQLLMLGVGVVSITLFLWMHDFYFPGDFLIRVLFYVPSYFLVRFLVICFSGKQFPLFQALLRTNGEVLITLAILSFLFRLSPYFFGRKKMTMRIGLVYVFCISITVLLIFLISRQGLVKLIPKEISLIYTLAVYHALSNTAIMLKEQHKYKGNILDYLMS